MTEIKHKKFNINQRINLKSHLFQEEPRMTYVTTYDSKLRPDMPIVTWMQNNNYEKRLKDFYY